MTPFHERLAAFFVAPASGRAAAGGRRSGREAVAGRDAGSGLLPAEPAGPRTTGLGTTVGSPTVLTASTASVAVLGEDAVAVAAPVAALLARRAGAAVLARLDEPAPSLAVSRPPTRRAARLAERLDGRGHRATASGRVVEVVLGSPAEGGRLTAAAGVPVVLAVPGARDADVDRLLAAQDVVVLAPRGGTAAALVAVAEDDLRAELPHATVLCGTGEEVRAARRRLAARVAEVLA